MRNRRPVEAAAVAIGSNLAGHDTALLEALWRGDELAAALRTAQAALAAREREIARAEEKIAELSEIADAAQAAINELRAAAKDAREAAGQDRELRDAIAAELFRIALRREVEQRAVAPGLLHSRPDENVPTGARQPLIRRWWRRLRRAQR
jgi:signal transduction histidine kinase